MTNQQHHHQVTKGQDVLDKGMIHGLGGKEWEGMRVHQATQNGAWIKTYELSKKTLEKIHAPNVHSCMAYNELPR